MKNTPLTMVAVLSCICIVVSAILGFVNFLTEDKIAAIAEEKVKAAMAEVIPNADFEEIKEGLDSKLETMYKATTDGNTIGVCVQLTVPGSQSDITLIVGIGNDLAVRGVRITAMNETGGLGSKANDESFLAQYVGLSGPLNVVKNNKTGENDILAISGATETTDAVTNGVQIALDAAKAYFGGDGK